MINYIGLDPIISIILGILTALLLFYLIFKKGNQIYRGPNSKNIKRKIFRDKQNNKCYALEPKIYLCPN